MAAQTEGNTYVANWEKTAGGYRAWLKRRPGQKVTGRKEDELQEQLWEIAMEAYGDGEACIEFVPPLPATRKSGAYFEPAWYQLNSNEGLHYEGDKAALYRGGLCPLCKTGQGGRNDVPRVLPPLRSDFGFIWWENPTPRLVSAAFLKFFGPLLGRFSMIECQPAKPTRKRFFELILSPSLELVAPKDASDATGMVCPKCDTRIYSSFVCERIQKGMTHGVVREQLLARKESVHVAGPVSGPDILVDEKVAARLRRTKLQGVLLKRLALIPKDEAGGFKLTKIKKGDYH